MINNKNANSIFQLKCTFLCLFAASLGCIISTICMNKVDDTNILLSEISYGCILGVYGIIILLLVKSENPTIQRLISSRSIPFIVGITLSIGLEIFAIIKQYLVIIKHKKIITDHATHEKNITKYNTLNYLFLSTILLFIIIAMHNPYEMKANNVFGLLAVIGIINIAIIILQFQYETFVTTRFTDG